MQIQLCESCRKCSKTDGGWVFLTSNDLNDLMRLQANTITWSICASCAVRKERGDDKDYHPMLSVQGSLQAERSLDENNIRRVQGD